MGTKRIVRTEIGEGCAMRERMFPKGLKKQDKEGENTAKIVYNAQKRCKIIVEKYVYIPIYNR